MYPLTPALRDLRFLTSPPIHSATTQMAGRTRGSTSPLAWSTLFYILLVFLLPFALLNSAHAEEEQKVAKDDLGDGEPGFLSSKAHS